MSDLPHTPWDHRVRAKSLRAAILYSRSAAVVLGAMDGFFPNFAAFAKAPSSFFYLLIGIPQFLGPLSGVLATNILDKNGKRRAFIIWSNCVQLICILPLIALPFFPPGKMVYGVLLTSVTLYSVAYYFMIPPFSSYLSDLVPSTARSNFFARYHRSMQMFQLITLASTVLALFLFDRSRFLYFVYVTIFAAAAIGRFVSILYQLRMYYPAYQPKAEHAFTFWQFIRRRPQSDFAKFVFFVAAFNFGTNIAAPRYVPYMGHDMGMEPWQIAVWTSLLFAAQMLSFKYWGRLTHRKGNKWTIAFTGYGLLISPLALLVSQKFYFFLGLQTVVGLFTAGWTLSVWNYVLESVSPEKRARCFAYYFATLGFGMLAGSLLGRLLHEKFPKEIWSLSSFLWLVVISSGARLAVSLFLLPTFREPRIFSKAEKPIEVEDEATGQVVDTLK
jgi:MFS family permease